MAGIVWQKRKESDNMLACKMVLNRLVVQRFVLSIPTLGTFNVWLFADTRHPLVLASNRITTATFLILPSSGKYICSAFKKLFEQSDFLIDGK